MRTLAPFLVALSVSFCARTATVAQPEWPKIEDETMRHFEALVRIDTSTEEAAAAEYVKSVLEREGIPVKTFALEPKRPSVVARIRGTGKKRPLLVMGHLDVVPVDPAKWKHPPFSATREGGYVYGRGTSDDKDQVAAGMMLMLMLKRSGTKLDRDVIFVAEAGEEGKPSVGMKHLVETSWPEIEAEYCLAEGGTVLREGGQPRYGVVATQEKIPRIIEVVAKGVAGHGSAPTRTNAVVFLSRAVARLADWRPPIRIDATTRTYFERLAGVAKPEEAARYRALLDPKTASEADEYLTKHEPMRAAGIRSTLTPTILSGGYRVNVVPSEAKATLDVRLLPDEDPTAFIEQLKRIVDDPAIDIRFISNDERPRAASRIDTDAFRAIEAGIKKHYGVITLPFSLPAATDMAFVRGKGAHCYGYGPALDREDMARGFSAHGDQERILEAELHRFVRLQWDVVLDLARAR